VIFVEYYLDVSEREQYKKRLAATKRIWKSLKHSLERLLTWHAEKWHTNFHWQQIWQEIESDAVSLGIDEPSAVRLTQSLAHQSEANKNGYTHSSLTSEISVSHSSSRNLKTEVRQKIAEWIANLSSGEYSVIEWVDFVGSLGNAFSFKELGEIRDRELSQQFVTFETISINPFGEPYNGRQLTVRRFIETLDDGVEIALVKIPSGTFEMGDDGWKHTSPRRRLSVSNFYLATLQVTQRQWETVARLPKVNLDLEKNPSYFRGDPDLPVDSVGWHEAIEFCRRLSQYSGRKYRLPSEAEWEYAARAGRTETFAFGETITPLSANFNGEFPTGSFTLDGFRNQTIRVGQFSANAFGLFDMHGNVWEWCADVWHEDYAGAPDNAGTWMSGGDASRRVLRGGAWCNWAELCRSSERIAEYCDEKGKLNYIGFRLALDL
jgi:formylglycine-generating enzyme required for sulfatase activity